MISLKFDSNRNRTSDLPDWCVWGRGELRSFVMIDDGDGGAGHDGGGHVDNGSVGNGSDGSDCSGDGWQG